MTIPLVIATATPVGFPEAPSGPIDVVVGGDGRILAAGPGIAASAPDGARRVDGRGLNLSPGWMDLHAHVWHGGTDISIRPSQCGLARGVTTVVDAGSAGEANFAGLREFVIERAAERVLAFLNIGSIGLVACNRVSELTDIRSIDIDRTLACVEANRDVIVGIKVRASGVILGGWGMTPVKIAKKVAKILKLPLMVHVGEPPPLYDEILEVLGSGDIVTHCFNGKAGGSLIEDEDLFRLAETSAARGVRLDVGHGGASFSFRVAEAAIARGLRPFSISTDLHRRSLDHPVWDLGTTMSKLMAVGLTLEEVVTGVTAAPAEAVGRTVRGRLTPGAEADLTLFAVEDTDLRLTDSMGDGVHIRRQVIPRLAVRGTHVVDAGRHIPPTPHSCPACGRA
jgi:dihydroorotase